jgi:anaerobic magnesium-protoporphyrin IX monomethyl ester cyclase
MKIGLINPPPAYIPDRSHPEFTSIGGIVFISSALRNAGYDVRTVDFQHNTNASIEEVRDCDVVGLTSYTDSYRFLRKTLPLLKDQNKARPVIVGGAFVSSYGLNDNLVVSELPEIDYAVIGEGEVTAVKLLRFLEGREKVPGGVVFRDPTTGSLKNTGKGQIVHSLDDLPETDNSQWPDFARSARGVTLAVQQTARGCYNRCSFCYLIEEGVRTMSPSRIKSDLEAAASLMPKDVHFSDDTFTYNEARTLEIARVSKQLGLKYIAMTRVNNVTPELMHLMKDSGCYEIFLGIESFDDKILRGVGKNITSEQAKKAIEHTRKAGIDPVGFFIVGLPGETRKSLDATIRTIKETGVFPCARVLIPLPGTAIYRQAVARGRIDELQFLKDFSGPGQFDTRKGTWVPINLSDGLSDQELIAARDEMNSIKGH